MQERRLRERVPFSLEVELQRPNGWTRIERSRDLSMGGLQISSTDVLEVGETVLLRLCLGDVSDIPLLEIPADVIRVETEGDLFLIGVRFHELPSDVSLFLFRLIQYHRS